MDNKDYLIYVTSVLESSQEASLEGEVRGA